MDLFFLPPQSDLLLIPAKKRLLFQPLYPMLHICVKLMRQMKPVCSIQVDSSISSTMYLNLCGMKVGKVVAPLCDIPPSPKHEVEGVMLR